jgi:hypothetical protein
MKLSPEMNHYAGESEIIWESRYGIEGSVKRIKNA